MTHIKLKLFPYRPGRSSVCYDTAWVDDGMDEMVQMRMGCEPCRPQAYSMYVGGHKATQSAADGHFFHVVGRPTIIIYRLKYVLQFSRTILRASKSGLTRSGVARLSSSAFFIVASMPIFEHQANSVNPCS